MKKATLPIILALVAVYLFWGGTYLAMKFAIETLPPLLMAGIRFVIAGGILFLWETLRGTKPPKLKHWINTAIIGGLMLLGGNGGIVWAEQVVPSGIAAIIVAAVPLWMALLSWLWQGNKRPSGIVSFGLILGFMGIILLVNNAGGTVGNTTSQWVGYAVCVAASLAWATGSVYSRVAEQPSAPFMSIGMQMLTGGMLCLTAGLLTGELSLFNLQAVSFRSIISLGYLIFFGSIIGYSSYIWLLKAAEPTLVSTYAYVNPVVALLLGWVFAGERLTLIDGIGAFIVVVSVVIITRFNSRGTSIPKSKEVSVSR